MRSLGIPFSNFSGIEWSPWILYALCLVTEFLFLLLNLPLSIPIFSGKLPQDWHHIRTSSSVAVATYLGAHSWHLLAAWSHSDNNIKMTCQHLKFVSPLKDRLWRVCVSAPCCGLKEWLPLDSLPHASCWPCAAFFIQIAGSYPYFFQLIHSQTGGIQKRWVFLGSKPAVWICWTPYGQWILSTLPTLRFLQLANDWLYVLSLVFV